MNRTLAAALVPLAFMAGAAVGPTGASAALSDQCAGNLCPGNQEAPPVAVIYTPTTFTPEFPSGCSPVTGRRLDDDTRPGPQGREVVLYRLECGDVQRSVLRRGPWLTVAVGNSAH
jgi:hypothetical protein